MSYKKNDKEYNAFEVVTKNIQKLANKRDKKKLKLPRLRSNSIFPSISKYPEKYKSFMKSIGIDLVNHTDKDKRILFRKINALSFFSVNKNKYDLRS